MTSGKQTTIDRRYMLQLLATGSAIVTLPQVVHGASSTSSHTILGSAKTSDGTHQVVGFALTGEQRFAHQLPGRGHGFAVSPDGRICAAFARRPGRFLFLIDLQSGNLIAKYQTPKGRHFYGHGVFSGDGKSLYTTENDFDGERGVIGVWNFSGGQLTRTGEYDSGGLGPHELRLMPDGHRLVVANGGIATTPDSGSAKLNIPTMRPNLAFIDAQTGIIQVRQKLPRELHKLSIRHIDVNAQGVVAIALQYQGPRTELVPLIAISDNGEALHTLQAPESTQRNMKHYVGSIRWDQSGTAIAATCPRADRCTFWSLKNGYEGELALRDVCAIAPGIKPGQFVIAGGKGDLALVENSRILASLHANATNNAAWDNHFGGS